MFSTKKEGVIFTTTLELDSIAKRLAHKSKILKMHAEIMKLRAKEQSYAQIALDLGLSESTVRTVCLMYEKEE